MSAMKVHLIAAALVPVCIGKPAMAALDFSRLCVAKVCLEDKSATVERIRAKFGPGQALRREDDAGGESYCYYDAQNNLWGEFTFGSNHQPHRRPRLLGITLTTAAMCSTNATSKAPIGPRAGRVRIGSSESELVQVMGFPDRVDDALQRERKNPGIKRTRYSARFGDRVYVYERNDDLGFVFVFLASGRVSTVWQSIAE